MKNNKLTRKRNERRLERMAKQQAVAVMEDGTEVLSSKEARQKVRRWSFEANVTLVMPEQKDADGNVSQAAQEMPLRRIKLEQTSFCPAKDIKSEIVSIEESLRRTNGLFAAAKLNVVAIPHETVSNFTLSQLTGYRDMSMILDKALQLAITEAQDVVSGRTVGSQFVESPAIAEDKEQGIEAKPARTTSSIKEDFYKRALDTIRKNLQETNGDTQEHGEVLPVPADAGEEVGEGKGKIQLTDDEGREAKAFVPEIVNPDSVIA